MDQLTEAVSCNEGVCYPNIMVCVSMYHYHSERSSKGTLLRIGRLFRERFSHLHSSTYTKLWELITKDKHLTTLSLLHPSPPSLCFRCDQALSNYLVRAVTTGESSENWMGSSENQNISFEVAELLVYIQDISESFLRVSRSHRTLFVAKYWQRKVYVVQRQFPLPLPSFPSNKPWNS